jgi:site-specific recombinase XerD
MQTAQEFNSELQRRHSMWQEVQGFAAETRYTANYAIKRFCKYLGDKPATKATHFDIQDHLYRLAKDGISAATLATRLSSLQGFYDFLNMGGMVKWVPPRLVGLTKKLPTPPPRVLTEEQVFKLIETASTDHERAMVEVLYGTGCRTGELASIRVEDVDFRAMRIRVTGKRGTRFVLFGPRVARDLRKYLGKRTVGYLFISNLPVAGLQVKQNSTGGWRCRWNIYDKTGVFKGYGRGRIPRSEGLTYPKALARFKSLSRSDQITRPRGVKPLRTSTIGRQIRNIGRRARISVTPYSLRHSYATHLLDHGANLRAIQELMGHKSLDSTRVYTHVSKNMLMETLEKCHPLSV